MALKDVAPVLAKDFTSLKIDTDRMVGGGDLLKRYNPKPGGIPWFVFIGPAGQPLVDSNDPARGNVGFPAQDFEIAHFKVMLEKVARKITREEIEFLTKSLVAFRDVKLPPR
jgi:hypothetical protein